MGGGRVGGRGWAGSMGWQACPAPAAAAAAAAAAVHSAVAAALWAGAALPAPPAGARPAARRAPIAAHPPLAHPPAAQTLEVLKEYKSAAPINSAAMSPLFNHVLIGGGQDAAAVTTTAAKAGYFEARFFHKVRRCGVRVYASVDCMVRCWLVVFVPCGCAGVLLLEMAAAVRQSSAWSGLQAGNRRAAGAARLRRTARTPRPLLARPHPCAPCPLPSPPARPPGVWRGDCAGARPLLAHQLGGLLARRHLLCDGRGGGQRAAAPL